ncbi:hypothetical protein BC835DRAFT_1305131 [Cytidiella melzeri]|nr:hypothetical protein BC835DRAFT_1305131 [Cytidiella melzeri]
MDPLPLRLKLTDNFVAVSIAPQKYFVVLLMSLHDRLDLCNQGSEQLSGILLGSCIPNWQRGNEVDVRIQVGLPFIEPVVHHLGRDGQKGGNNDGGEEGSEEGQNKGDKGKDGSNNEGSEEGGEGGEGKKGKGNNEGKGDNEGEDKRNGRGEVDGKLGRPAPVVLALVALVCTLVVGLLIALVVVLSLPSSLHPSSPSSLPSFWPSSPSSRSPPSVALVLTL